MNLRRGRGLRSALAGAGALGIAAGLLTAACGDDTASPDPGTDAAPALDAPVAEADSPSTVDAGTDPDARGRFEPEDVPVACDASPCATQIVAGNDHFCARMSDGTVRCWGDNAFGVLGTMPEPDFGFPEPVPVPAPAPAPAPDAADAGPAVHVIGDLSGVTQLSAAGATTCALLQDGSVKCWGDNSTGQLGLALDPPAVDWDPHPTPSLVALDSPAKRVEAGHGAACALLASGQTWCWGKDDEQQLVRASAEPVFGWPPVRGPGLASLEPLTATGLAIGESTMLGLSDQGEVWSWGSIHLLSGRVGSVSPTVKPKRVAALTNVTKLVVSAWIQGMPEPPLFVFPPPRAHACALAGGEIYCWGVSDVGALCTGRPDPEPLPAHAPIPLAAKAWPQQLAVGDEITCARMTDGTVHCCGSDVRGRLGTGKLIVLSPWFTRAQAFTGYAVQVATSNRAVCALMRDGTVECWGSNEKGELGRTPDDTDHPSPVKVAF
ncbi:MAG: hypothetical protein KF901_32570 [Myxococcales bacterium]|nr:hypothetical protein [Myxococcales bacterium]